jgi:hypothetical protein
VDCKGWKHAIVATRNLPGGAGKNTVGARPRVEPAAIAAQSYPIFRKLSHFFFVLRVDTDTFQQHGQQNELPDVKFSLPCSVQYITQ